MALSTYAKFDTNGELRLYDGGSASLVCQYVNGDVKVTGLSRRLNQATPVIVRERIVSVNYGTRIIPAVSFSEVLANMIASAAPGPVRDFLTGTGAYTANVSVQGTNRPYAVAVELKVEGSDFNDPNDDILRLNNVCFVHDFGEGKPNMNNWTGQVFGNVLLNGVEVYREINSSGV